MQGLFLLSSRHLLHHWRQTIILTLCITVALALPFTSASLVAQYRKTLTVRADASPLLAGAKGNRFDLTLNALYFRQSELAPIPYAEYEKISATGVGKVVPLNTGHTARQIPLVGIGYEYFKCRDLRPAQGTLPQFIGDVVLGANVAVALGLKPGAALFTDQKDIYDISKPPALKLRVVGILAPSQTADDDVVFVDIKTIWILEGIAHGHRAVAGITDPKLLFGKTAETIVVSPAFIEYNEVTAETLDSYHAHGDTATLPLTAVLVWPRDEKAATILKGDVNLSRDYQMVVPREVIDDLLAVVFRIKAIFDLLALVLGASTVLLIMLVVLLSIRLRRGEIQTLQRIGCSRFAVVFLYAYELGIIIILSVGLALLTTWGLRVFLPDLLAIF